MKPLIVLILLILMGFCQAKTLIVDPSGSGDAKTLYDAIFLASSGDSIVILPGSYPGATVDRSLNISGSGQAIIEGSLAVTAPGCNISDITVKAVGDNAAISLQSEGCQLLRCSIAGIATAVSATGENNTIRECQIDSPKGLEVFGMGNEAMNSTIRSDVAIRINRTSKGLISGCRISAIQGILIEDSIENIIVNNTFSGSGFGVVLTRSQYNKVFRNNLSGTFVSGLDMVDSSDNNLTENQIEGGKVGISLRGARHCNITENICRNNERAGIFCDAVSQNLLANNQLKENGNGILLSGSAENLISSNQAWQNIYGISLRGSTKNVLRGNILRNNSYNLRVEAADGVSSRDSFVQDIDMSNLVDSKPVCYLVGKAGLVVPSECGFLGLVSCRDIRASNLTISNSSSGVLLVDSTNCSIQNGSVSRCENGFFLLDSIACNLRSSKAAGCKIGFAVRGSTGSKFIDVRAQNCSAEGFRADDALELGLMGCIIDSSSSGISLHGSRMCMIQNCSMSLNQEEGILLAKSSNCTILGNAASQNQRGISLVGSSGCAVYKNNVSKNLGDGISLEQLSDVDVNGNTASENGQGIFVQSAKRLGIFGNTLYDNGRFGLRMSSSQACNITDNNIYNNQIAGANLVDCFANFLYHNIFADNGFQNAADNGKNRWDAGSTKGGNYWSDHEVSGNPGNVPRQIPGGNVDRYPFQNPGGWR